MKKTLLTITSLLIAVAGGTQAQNKFFTARSETGFQLPVYSAVALSPDGKYVTGNVRNAAASIRAFLWEVEATETVTELSEPQGVGNYVLDGGVVIGTFPDNNYLFEGVPITSGGIYKDGNWISLGLGAGKGEPNVRKSSMGSYPTAATPDGKIIVGNSSVYEEGREQNDTPFYPYSWTDVDGEWVEQKWAMPDNWYSGGSIRSISADGKTAVGWANISGGGQTTGVIWTSPTECKLLLDEVDSSDCLAISPNGRYVACKYKTGAGLLDLETNTFEIIPGAYLASGVSNDGIVVGMHKVYIGIEYSKGFIWSTKLGFVDWGEFMTEYAPDITLERSMKDSFDRTKRGNSYVTAISADGRNIVGYSAVQNNQGGGRAFVLKLDQPIKTYAYIKNVEATIPLIERNNVILKWNIPEADDVPLTGYTIYRDNVAIATVYETSNPTYTDRGVSSGDHSYTIQAIYGDKKSRQSEPTTVRIMPTFAVPLFEHFDSHTLKTNEWSLMHWGESEQADIQLIWASWNDVGVGDDGNGMTFHSVGFMGAYSSSLVSRPLDASELDEVYLSFMAAPFKYEDTIFVSPDTMAVEINIMDPRGKENNEWIKVDEFVMERDGSWENYTYNLTELAGGEYFRFRIRIHGENSYNTVKYTSLDDIRVTAGDPTIGVESPTGLIAQEYGDDKLNLAWLNKGSLYGLTYAQTAPLSKNSMGDEGKKLMVVNSFDRADLDVYAADGHPALYSISFFLDQYVSEISDTAKVRLAVFVDDQEPIFQEVTDKLKLKAWNTVILEEFIPLSSVKNNIKFGYEISDYDIADRPIGVDQGRPENPSSGKGDLYSTNSGRTWRSLADSDRTQNWSLIGDVEPRVPTIASTSNVGETIHGDVIGYEIFRNGKKIHTGLHFAQNLLTDKVEGLYSVRSYSLTESMSANSTELNVVISSIEGNYGAAEFKGLKLYPNPVKDILYIETTGEVTALRIYNAAGTLVKSFTAIDGSVDVSNLPVGVYLINVETATNSYTSKLVKK